MAQEVFGRDIKAEKARERRFRKTRSKLLNVDAMGNDIYDMIVSVGDAQMLARDHTLLGDALEIDEEEENQIIIAFDLLLDDLQRLYNDLYEEWIPECFDDVMGFSQQEGGIEFYDDYEQDYFGFDNTFDEYVARQEEEKHILRLTKIKILETCRQSYAIAMAYQSVKARYEDLKGAIDIINGENKDIAEAIRTVSDLYDDFEKQGFTGDLLYKFENALSLLPDECWLR